MWNQAWLHTTGPRVIDDSTAFLSVSSCPQLRRATDEVECSIFAWNTSSPAQLHQIDRDLCSQLYRTDRDLCSQLYQTDRDLCSQLYRTDRDLCSQLYRTDRDLCLQLYQTDRGLCSQLYQTDRGLCSQLYRTDRDLCSQLYQTDRGLCSQLYQTDRGLCLQLHRTDRDLCSQLYQTDRDLCSQLYQTDRDLCSQLHRRDRDLCSQLHRTTRGLCSYKVAYMSYNMSYKVGDTSPTCLGTYLHQERPSGVCICIHGYTAQHVTHTTEVYNQHLETEEKLRRRRGFMFRLVDILRHERTFPAPKATIDLTRCCKHPLKHSLTDGNPSVAPPCGPYHQHRRRGVMQRLVTLLYAR